MRWPEAGADPFPAPRRREPENLRRDILDELADHLALSVEEEMEVNGQSEEKAWDRALARFGNPDAVARRLWWDAMKEEIIRTWIQAGIAVVLVAIAALTAVFLVQNMRQMQATQAELIKVVREMGSAQSPEAESLPLEIEVRRGTPDGPPATNVKVYLSGKLAGNETSSEAVLDTDSDGRVRFYPVPQGKYDLRFDDPQSTMSLSVSHSLFAGVGSALQVLAPPIPRSRHSSASIPNCRFRTSALWPWRVSKPRTKSATSSGIATALCWRDGKAFIPPKQCSSVTHVLEE